MIEYNYEMIRKSYESGKKPFIFVPDKIPAKLPSIVYIIGENSLGKSTLLHIIAFGFYGMRNDSIDEILKRKMENLIRKDQQLKFKVTITNKDNTLKLITEKKELDSNDFEVYEMRNNNLEKKYLNPQKFKERYKLIYDIPYNPTGRLTSLIDDIEQFQNELSSKLSKFRTEVKDKIKEIKDSDPSKKMNAEKSYNDLLKQQEDIKGVLPGLKSDLNYLEKTIYYNFYNNFKKKYTSIKKEIDTLSKSIASKEYKIGEGKDLLNISVQKARKEIFDLRDLRDKTSKTFKPLISKLKSDEKYLIQMWDEINFLSVIEQRGFPDNFKLCLEELEKIFNRIEKENTEKDTYKVLTLYQELVNILEKNKTLDVQLPKLDASITEFIAELKKLITKKKDLINLIKNVRDAKEELNKIKNEKEKIEKEFINKIDEIQIEIQELDEKKKEEIQELIHSDELKKKRAEAKQIEKQLEIYEKKYRDIGSPKHTEVGSIGKGDLKDYGDCSDDQLIDYIDEMKKSIHDKEKKLSQIELRLEICKKDIDKLSDIKPHKYQEHEKKLNLLLQLLNMLQKKIDNQFIPFLKNIREKKTEKTQKTYNSAVSEYLGKMVGKVFHMTQYYDVESIDLLEDFVNTKSGEKIRLSDMGTGQSQSAYFQSLLKDTKEEKIIALFDEATHMDERSLRPIFLRLKELYDQGKLMLAILVKMKEKGLEIKDLCDYK